MRRSLGLLAVAAAVYIGWTLWSVPFPAPATPESVLEWASIPFARAYAAGVKWLSSLPSIASGEEITLTISAAGDVTHGGDRRKGSDLFARELERQDGDYAFPFRNVRSLFEADDLTIVNYECALTKTKPVTDNTYSFAGSPENAQALALGGIEAVALDNNHVFDHGQRGYTDTQAALREAGIAFSGNGLSSVYQVKGVRIGMLSYCTLRTGYATLAKRVPGDIQTLRDQGCGLVIVSYHWGEEREYVPHQRQLDLGRATVDAGADLVLGHHSHVVNPIEQYKGKYIVYSLANFSFAGNANPSDKDTFIFQQRFTVTQDGVKDAGMHIVPCRVSSIAERNDFAPTPYGKEDAERIAQKLADLGKGMKYALEAYPLGW